MTVIRVVSYLITAILSVTFTLIGQGAMRASKTPGSANQITDAAFRDGRYMAKLDMEKGRKPHVSLGRWSSIEDRTSYAAGYQQVYPQSLFADGVRDQNSLLGFHLSKTGSYPTVGGCPSSRN